LHALCFHTPVPRLVEKALYCTPGYTSTQKIALQQSLAYPRKIGNSYTASLFVALLSLLEQSDTNLSGSSIGLFSYGSGSCADFFTGVVGPAYQALIPPRYTEHQLQARATLTFGEYEQWHRFEPTLDRTGSYEFSPEALCIANLVRANPLPQSDEDSSIPSTPQSFATRLSASLLPDPLAYGSSIYPVCTIKRWENYHPVYGLVALSLPLPVSAITPSQASGFASALSSAPVCESAITEPLA
jgi:hypothetical protein